METITLNNGVDMPMLGFGTYQISDPVMCERCVVEAAGIGYRLFDTAPGIRKRGGRRSGHQKMWRTA